jgi:hypothetical protein
MGIQYPNASRDRPKSLHVVSAGAENHRTIEIIAGPNSGTIVLRGQLKRHPIQAHLPRPKAPTGSLERMAARRKSRCIICALFPNVPADRRES